MYKIIWKINIALQLEEKDNENKKSAKSVREINWVGSIDLQMSPCIMVSSSYLNLLKFKSGRILNIKALTTILIYFL